MTEPTRKPLEQRVARLIGDNHSAAYMCDPKLSADVIALVREHIAAEIEAYRDRRGEFFYVESVSARNAMTNLAARIAKGDSR